MEERDVELRNLTYLLFVEFGRAPLAAEIGQRAGMALLQVQEGWRRLHSAHALVVDPINTEIRMANPFSAVPTAHRVKTKGHWWFANCAWDAFGICGALHEGGRIETACPDCGEAIAIEVRDQRPDSKLLLFHSLLPARRWWDDITFT
jgi:hypothetical protein